MYTVRTILEINELFSFVIPLLLDDITKLHFLQS